MKTMIVSVTIAIFFRRSRHHACRSGLAPEAGAVARFLGRVPGDVSGVPLAILIGGYWYLIRGSITEYRMSTIRLAITREAAPINVTAMITGKSRAKMASSVNRPTPGMP